MKKQLKSVPLASVKSNLIGDSDLLSDLLWILVRRMGEETTITDYELATLPHPADRRLMIYKDPVKACTVISVYDRRFFTQDKSIDIDDLKKIVAANFTQGEAQEKSLEEKVQEKVKELWKETPGE